MGLLVSIYSNKLYTGCSNGGISDRFTQVCVVNAEGPFVPDEKTPAVIIKQGAYRGTAIAVPARKDATGAWIEETRPDRIGPMAGGSYIGCSDSRFNSLVERTTGARFYGAVPLHDRFETQVQYDANFD